MDPGLITESDVRQALGRVLSSGPAADCPLAEMNVVTVRLDAAAITSTPEARAWALAALLADLVGTQLRQLRGRSNDRPQPPVSRDDQLAAIAADFRSGSVDREAWSCLYHRYLSPYPLTVQGLADVAQPGAVHGRRYISRRLDRGYTLLANHLRELERGANERAAASASPPSRLSEITGGRAIKAERDADDLLATLAAAIRAGEPPAELTEDEIRRLLARPPCDLAEYRLGRIAEWSQPRHQLDRRFVALTLLVDQGEEAEGGRWSARQERYDDLGTLLAAVPEPAVVVLGPPGSGKSTLLRHLELDTALSALRGEDDRDIVTFFIQLNRYRPVAPGLPLPAPADWLAAQWATRHPDLVSLDDLLAEGRVVLLLDALNEMPTTDSRHFRETVAVWKDWLVQLTQTWPGNRVVFSCRTLDYSAPLSTPALRVPQVQVEALDDDKVREFLEVHSPSHAEAIWAVLAGTPQLDSLRAPYFLGLFVDQVEATGEIEPDRAALFTGFVRQALKREVERDNPVFASEALWHDRDGRRIAQWRWRNPHELPERGALVPRLARLASQMQAAGTRGEMGQVRVVYDSAMELLDHPEADGILRAGVALGILDEDPAADEVLYRHQLIQEYFAARDLAREPRPAVVTAPWRIDDLRPGLREILDTLPRSESLPALPTTGWEETTILAAAMVEQPEPFLRALMAPNLVVAGRAANVPRVQPQLSPKFLDELRWALVARSRDPLADLRARIDAGLALGDLGDPRFERREGPYGPYLLPPFIDVAGGKYPIGDDQPIRWKLPGISGDTSAHVPRHQVEMSPFQIGTFAVTRAEWACFMAGGGYDDDTWWETEDSRRWRRGEMANEGAKENNRGWRKKFLGHPSLFEQMESEGLNPSVEYTERWRGWLALDEAEFEVALEHHWKGRQEREPALWRSERYRRPTQPVVGVCWYEAQAYCAWLAAQSGLAVRLPTEVEWEAAARGATGRSYPWGDEFDPLKANTYDTRVRRTTPVGVFPDGDSAAGVADMSGNVVEWTSSLFGAVDDESEVPDYGYPYEANDGREDAAAPANVNRVVRGGGWDDDGQGSVRPVDRDHDFPDTRSYGHGLRVAVGRRRSPIA